MNEPTWGQIVGDPAFQSLPGEDKEFVRNKFWETQIEPRIPYDKKTAIRAEFDRRTRESTTADFWAYQGQQARKGLLDLATIGPATVQAITAIDRRVGPAELRPGFVGPVSAAGQEKLESERRFAEGAKVYEDFIRRGLGLESEKAPSGAFARYVGAGTEFATSGAAGEASLIRAAPGMVPKLLRTVRAGISSYGAGLGAEAAHDIASAANASPTARFLATLAGAMAGGRTVELIGPTAAEVAWRRRGEVPGAAKGAAEAGKEFVQAEVGKRAARAGEFMTTEMGKRVEASVRSDPGAAESMRRAREVEKALKAEGADVRFSLSQLTGSREVAALGTAILAEKPELIEQVATAEQKAGRTIVERLKTSFGAAEPLAPEVSKIVQRSTAEIAAAQSEVQEQINQLANQRLTAAFGAEQGKELVALRGAQVALRRAVTDKAYSEAVDTAKQVGFDTEMGDVVRQIRGMEAADANWAQRSPRMFDWIKRNVTAESDARVAGMKREINDINDRMAEAAGNPSRIAVLRNRARGLEQQVSALRTDPKPVKLNAEQLHSLRTEIRRDKIDLWNRGDYDAARKLEAIETSLTVKFDGNVAVGDAFRRADGLYKQFADAFYRNAGGRMVEQGAFGAVTAEERIMEKLFLRNGEKGAEDFFKVFGEDNILDVGQAVANRNKAVALARDGVLDSLNSSLRGKPLTSDAIRRFMGRPGYAKFLNARSEFGGIVSELGDIGKAADALAERQSELNRMEKELNTSIMRDVIGTGNPEGALRAGVNNVEFMTALTGMARGNPQIAKAAVSQYGSIMMQMSGEKAMSFLSENRVTLKPLFESIAPGQWDRVALFTEARNIAERQATGGRVSPEIQMDPVAKQMGIEVGALLNRIYNMGVFGRGGKMWNFLTITARAVKTQAMDAMRNSIARAYYEPAYLDEINARLYGAALDAPGSREAYMQMLTESGLSVEQAQEMARGLASRSLSAAWQSVKSVYKEAGEAVQNHDARVLMAIPRVYEESAQEPQRREEAARQFSGAR